ncbi:MAG TPA: universal stress protein [Terriglobia bacterium]|nr:universal stress protein [Terriglobia bacterium]
MRLKRLRFRLGNIAAESANALRRAGLIATTHVVDGDPREVILTAAEVTGADTIFVGARGHGPASETNFTNQLVDFYDGFTRVPSSDRAHSRSGRGASFRR